MARPGEKLDIKASTWNTLLSVAQRFGGGQVDGGAAGALGGRGKDNILVTNLKYTAIPRHSAVGLGPLANDASTADEPVFEVVFPWTEGLTPVVLKDNAPPLGVARAAISGQVKANTEAEPGETVVPDETGAFIADPAGTTKVLAKGAPGVVLLGSAAPAAEGPDLALQFATSVKDKGSACNIYVEKGEAYYSVAPKLGETGTIQADTVPCTIINEEEGKIVFRQIRAGKFMILAEFAFPEDPAVKRPREFKVVLVPWGSLDSMGSFIGARGPRYYPIAIVDVAPPASKVTQLHLGAVVVFRPEVPPADYDDAEAIKFGGPGDWSGAAREWTLGGDATTGNKPAGLSEWYVTRVTYDAAHDQVLYAHVRNRRFSPEGRLVYVSAEQKVVIDTPVQIAL